ncbi:transcriptional regulator DeoR family [Clostridium sp. CAG:411]|jgi:DeoR family fructose operon transcriptional repressor|nr:DeoR/GlpR family DNA-binding transcription regulator [Lachnospiraceae bacterium]CDE44385.1 transcriptional regulator DeoR family [Clostridium sp. CAG:411]
MLSEERHSVILQLLQERKAVTVTEFTKILGISESTIRRDLNTLAGMGKINKVHGGATVIEEERKTIEENVAEKEVKNVEEKNKIVKYAAGLIRDDDFIYLDAGTTTGKLIDCIKRTKAVFVTNGIFHAKRLTQKGIKVFLLGGELKLSTEAMIGMTALDALKQYNFTKAFLGANGIHEQYGFTTPDPAEAMIKKEVMNRSFMRCVLADSSKFGQISSVSFGNLSQACIVTDRLKNKKYADYTVIREVGL